MKIACESSAHLADAQLTLTPVPPMQFGAGAVNQLPGLVRATKSSTALIVTDPGLADKPVVARVLDALAGDDIKTVVFAGVRPNPTTDDVAAGAEVAAGLVTEAGHVTLVAVGGGSAIDAAKGIALAAVNPQRGRNLDYRNHFSHPALRIVAVPTTAGTGAETNAFGVVTDPATQRKFYVGHASSLPAAVILDPELTVGLPPSATAATGMDALTHALESCMSRRANPWSQGIALQVIRMVASYLPRAVANGADLEARSQMLLASHMAGIGMASTGLGLCHAIGHSLGGRFDITHGVALTMVLPGVLAFNLPACSERLAAVAFACGTGDTARDDEWNSATAIYAIIALSAQVGMTAALTDFGITSANFDRIATDALNDEVIDNTPRRANGSDIVAILSGA